MVEKDLLGHLLNFKDENGETLTKDQISDNIIGVLFAAQDTTASVLTWILKYLHDDQKLLEAVNVILTRTTFLRNIIYRLFSEEEKNKGVLNYVSFYLQAEQKAIFEANDGGRKPLTWAQTRNMPLTYKV